MVWRASAAAADIAFKGLKVPKGTYTIYVLPDGAAWQLAVSLTVLALCFLGGLLVFSTLLILRLRNAFHDEVLTALVVTGSFLLIYLRKTNPPEEGADAFADESTEALRLCVIFLGFSPYRVSLDVELDRSGNVTSVAAPYGWD